MTTPELPPPFTETFDIGTCVVNGCEEVADSVTRDVTHCGCSQSVVNCMRGHRVIVSVIQPACIPGRPA